MQVKEKLINLHVTLFGLGNLPKAPGTYGSIGALFVLFIPFEYRFYSIFALLVVNFILGLKTIEIIEQKDGNDPSFVVIDEAIGMWIILLSPFIPHNFLWVLIGLILFRYFDIRKPYPISKINNKKGAFFVIFDDVIAALFSSVILHILYLGYQILPFYMYFLLKK